MDDIAAEIVLEAEYTKLNTEIRRSLKRSAAEVVRLGHLLRCMMEEKLYQVYYTDFDTYLHEELHMEYTLANRFMGINRKYSLGGNSEDIDEKYKEYSQGLLVEMLNMPPELEAKVEPDMTVKQVREIKRQARQKSVKMRPDVRGLMDDTYCAVCGNPLSEMVRLEKCPECGQMQDWGWLDKVSGEVQQEEPGEEGGTVIEGEYKEIDTPEAKEPVAAGVATSQPEKSAYGLDNREYPEESAIVVSGCGAYDCFSCAQDCNIRQEDRYCTLAPLGDPFLCTTMAALGNLKGEVRDKCQFVNNGLARHMAGSGAADPCCRDCKELCVYRCQRAPLQEGVCEADTGLQDSIDQEPVDEMRLLRSMLEEAKQRLRSYLELGGIPELTVHKQRLIVGALANMACELDAQQEKEAEVRPELPALKNNNQRKQWLNDYRAWGLWYRDENIDVNYYKFDFIDGSRLVVAEYPQRFAYWTGGRGDEFHYHLLEKNKKGYTQKYDEEYRHQADSETYLVEFLKDIQKKG